MSRALALLPLAGCFSVSELSPQEPCRQARLAVGDRVWTCSGDTDRSLEALDRFDKVYACEIEGWGETFLSDEVELERDVRLSADGATLSLPAALSCAETVRATACDLALSPLEEGWVRGVDLVCAQILSGPEATWAQDTGVY